jgi:hypothetical protein
MQMIVVGVDFVTLFEHVIDAVDKIDFLGEEVNEKKFRLKNNLFKFQEA